MIIQLFRKLLKGNINDMEIKYTGLMRFEENGFYFKQTTRKQKQSKRNFFNILPNPYPSYLKQ